MDLVGPFKWVMLAGGLVTLTMLQAVVTPRNAFRGLLGAEPEGPLALLLARNWGVLVALTGAGLIWGAFHPADRPLVLVAAIVSKAAFLALVIGHPPFRRKATLAIAVDGVLVALFAAYLIATL